MCYWIQFVGILARIVASMFMSQRTAIDMSRQCPVRFRSPSYADSSDELAVFQPFQVSRRICMFAIIFFLKY